MPRALAAAAALALAACTGDDEKRPGRPGVLDERRGTYLGVAMGMSEGDVERILGAPGEGGGFFPLGTTYSEIGGAPAVRVWPPESRRKPLVMRYDDTAFLVGERGVFAFVVTAEGARTAEGVAVGDPLARAHEHYRLGCVDAVAGEGAPGEKTPTFRSCRGTIDRRFRIWFGRDPIRSITLARVGAR